MPAWHARYCQPFPRPQWQSKEKNPDRQSPIVIGAKKSTDFAESILFQFNGSKEAFQAIEVGFFFEWGIEHLAQIVHGIGNGADRFWERRAAGIGMTAALKFFSHFQSFAVAAAQAGDDHSAGPPEKGEQNRIRSGGSFQELVHDEVVIAQHCIDVTHGWAEGDDIILAPLETQWIFHPPLDGHDFQE